MRTFTKIFVAVVALFALSCATDLTEDLGVKVGGGQTEITLSLEESRTQLGEKAGTLYPLLWSEGDAISVNGVASTALTAQQAGASAATFTIDGTVAAPYCIAYPAAAANQVLGSDRQCTRHQVPEDRYHLGKRAVAAGRSLVDRGCTAG